MELSGRLNAGKEYAENKVECRRFDQPDQPSMFCNAKQPHATHPMRHCKGAECKHLVKPLLAVLRKMLGEGMILRNLPGNEPAGFR